MRVSLLVHDLRPSGGVKVILSHARALDQAGHEVELVLTRGRPPPFEGVAVSSLEDARATRCDLAIATWWETAPTLYELRAERRLAFLQSFEQRFYTEDEPLERQGAAAVLALPVDFVVVSDWMKEVLGELRPDARCRVVRNGVPKQVFAGARRSRGGGPLRVLIEGQPSLWFKGVQQAIAAARAMREPAQLTLVALDPPPGELDVDRVVGDLSPAQMAELYADSDVLLKLSRIEGLGLPLVEAAHAGVPCVATQFGSHFDLVQHGRNGLVVGFDDEPGTTRALDLLAADRDLLESLSEGALALAAEWPSEEESGCAFATAIEELSELDPADPVPGLRELLAGLRFVQETGRGIGRDEQERVRGAELALADAQALVHELSVSRDECAGMLNEAREELQRIRSTLPYRVASRAKAAVRRTR
jgi:glycosyltransferase involved in cell wall biosynthesis